MSERDWQKKTGPEFEYDILRLDLEEFLSPDHIIVLNDVREATLALNRLLDSAYLLAFLSHESRWTTEQLDEFKEFRLVYFQCLNFFKEVYFGYFEEKDN